MVGLARAGVRASSIFSRMSYRIGARTVRPLPSQFPNLSNLLPYQNHRSHSYFPNIALSKPYRYDTRLLLQAQIRRMRRGAQSHLMRCSDGNYDVVKFPNNPQHPRIPANADDACAFQNFCLRPTAPRVIRFPAGCTLWTR
jgi:hypothetical protein